MYVVQFPSLLLREVLHFQSFACEWVQKVELSSLLYLLERSIGTLLLTGAD